MGNDARRRAWSYQGAPGERLLLLALAEHIPDDKDTCWPSVETLANMVSSSVRQVQRLVKSLEQAGAIVTMAGSGRGHTTRYGLLIGLSDDRQADVRQHVKGVVIMSPFTQEVSSVSPVKGDIKPDIAMSPILEEKVTFGTEKVTFDPLKGDIAMSPRNMNRKRNERSERETRAQQTTLDTLHEGVTTYKRLTGKKNVPPIVASTIAERVTDCARFEQVAAAWIKAGYKPDNLDGILDWYDHPEKMERRNGAHPNGRSVHPNAPSRGRIAERLDKAKRTDTS